MNVPLPSAIFGEGAFLAIWILAARDHAKLFQGDINSFHPLIAAFHGGVPGVHEPRVLRPWTDLENALETRLSFCARKDALAGATPEPIRVEVASIGF